MPTTALTVHLRHFTTNQLLFDDKETKTILIFFFPHDTPQIKNVEVTTTLREFAQALLVAAVDASASAGWVKALFQSTISPNASMKKVLKSLGKKAATHWFKQIGGRHDLIHQEIYDVVRDIIQSRFHIPFRRKLFSKTTESQLPAGNITFLINTPTTSKVRS